MSQPEQTGTARLLRSEKTLIIVTPICVTLALYFIAWLCQPISERDLQYGSEGGALAFGLVFIPITPASNVIITLEVFQLLAKTRYENIYIPAILINLVLSFFACIGIRLFQSQALHLQQFNDSPDGL